MSCSGRASERAKFDWVSPLPFWTSSGRLLNSAWPPVNGVDGSSETFRVGNARRTITVYTPDGNGSYYDLHPDGKRVLQTGADPEFRAEVSFLHLVTDWRRGLVQ